MEVLQFAAKLLLLGIFSSTGVFLLSVASRFVPACTLQNIVLCTTYPGIISLVSFYLCISFLCTAYYFFTGTDMTETTFKKAISMPWSLCIAAAILCGGYILLSGI